MSRDAADCESAPPVARRLVAAMSALIPTLAL